MTECLARILFPGAPSSFLEHYRTRKYLHISRSSPNYYEDILSDASLDELLRSDRLPPTSVNVVKDGHKYSLDGWSRLADSSKGEHRVLIPERLLTLYLDGATLILNHADRTVPSLNAACSSLTLETGFPAWANVYLTPRAASGFARHTDDHEVLVLQIAGTKRWLLYPRDEHPAEIDLHSGDLLYMPAGIAHSARTQETDSIHITVGLQPPYAFELIGELAKLAAEEDVFRHPLPPRFAGEDARREFEKEFVGHLRNLASRASASELIERRFRSRARDEGAGSARFSDLRLLHRITPETVVRRRPEIQAAVRKDGRSLMVDLAGTSLAIPSFLESALDKIMSGKAFAIGDIEGFISTPGKVKLISELIKSGLLRILNI